MMKDKLLSARFIMAVSLTVTFCAMAIMKMVPIELFVVILTIVVRDYFERNDRKKEITQ